MRTPTLQYLYLQKPLILLLFIATVSVVCWIGMGEFYSGSEPKEATTAMSMIDGGNWILPHSYADEFTYKPPLTNWLIAIFSLPQEEVTPFTSRLPSALAYIIMVGVCFIFFGKRMRFQEAFIACLIIITSFEIHRAAMTARFDMVFTLLTVMGLIGLFRWEEGSKLKVYPVSIPIILGCAALVKGITGILLPVLIFGIYLLFLKYNFWKTIFKCTIIILPAFILPSIWCFLAYQEGGTTFLNMAYSENFGIFSETGTFEFPYYSGPERNIWWYLITLLAGLLPWTIIFFFSLFGINYSMKKIPGIKKIGYSLLDLPKIKLFSLLATVIFFIYYLISGQKHGAYLIPAYPFIAIFLAQYILYLTEYKTKVTKVFSVFITFLGCIAGLICILSIITHVINPVEIVDLFIDHVETLSDIALIWSSFTLPRLLYVILFVLLVFALYFSCYQLTKKNNLKILYATIGVCFAINLIIDGIISPSYKNKVSAKPIAKDILESFPEKSSRIYVMNNPYEYSNMYGLNYYLNNSFKNFEKILPESGLLLIGQESFYKMMKIYNENYNFVKLKQYENRAKDGEKIICIYSIEKLK